jgi:hypothetical protein
MSPPALFRGPQPRYSMGAMGMDNNLVLLEERQSQVQGGSVTKGQWASFAGEMFDQEHERFTGEGGEAGSEGDVEPAPTENESPDDDGDPPEEELTAEEEEAERRYQRYADELGSRS